MKVIVGSKNPVKIKATENILEKIYGEVDVTGIDVDSEVPDQPFGKEQTIQGAINRAKNAYSNDFDLSVGIESGLMEIPNSITDYIDLQWCAIFDGDKITLGVSAGFEYPPLVIEEVLKGKEVGEVMDKVTGVDNLGQKTGAVSYLSKGMLDRTENTEQCVLTAMIPRINNEIYNKEQ
jgi:inosine/xanthosine triphosphatase